MLIKMKLAWSFIAPLLVLSSTVAAASHERDLLQGIVGGTTANASDFPFFVQSQVIGPQSDGKFGGGSLILRDVVLTAASNAAYFLNGSLVLVGSNKFSQAIPGSEVSRVVSQKIHPSYNASISPALYNIMLVKIDRVNSTNITDVRINLDPKVPALTETLTTIGFGSIQSNPPPSFPFPKPDSYPTDLQRADFKLVDFNKCVSVYNNVLNLTWISPTGPKVICVESQDKGACKGDLGAPLLRKAADGKMEQVGVFGAGYGCGFPNTPDLYASVAELYAWVKTEAEALSDFNLPSPPTNAPTLAPSTLRPTKFPTLAPTRQPTLAPTFQSCIASKQPCTGKTAPRNITTKKVLPCCGTDGKPNTKKFRCLTKTKKCGACVKKNKKCIKKTDCCKNSCVKGVCNK